MTKTTSTPKTSKNTAKTAVHDHDHDHSGHTHAQDQQPVGLPIAPNSHIHITLKWADVEPAYQKGVRRFAQTAKVDGFRKGKVPVEMVEKMIDQSALVEYVLQLVLPDTYAAVVKAEDKHPISQPEIEPIEIEKGKDWKLTASFAEAPVINIDKYKDIVKKAKKAAQKDIADQEAELVKKAKEAPKTETEKAAKSCWRSSLVKFQLRLPTNNFFLFSPACGAIP